MPLVSSSLRSTKENLAIEAIFAFHEIARRTDGGVLLRSRVPEIAEFLGSRDERLAGGSIETLELLTPSDADVTLPIMIKLLDTPEKATVIKAETASALLHFRGDDAQALTVVERFLDAEMKPEVQARTLQVIGLNHVSSAGIDHFLIRSLSNADSDVKIAAISIAREIGPQAWNEALPIITRLATAPSEDPKMQRAAEEEIQNRLDKPARR